MSYYAVGCDLGGTNFRAGIVDLATGEILAQSTTPTLAREGHDAVMRRMGELINNLIAGSHVPRPDIQSVGVGVPGVLDLERGLTLFLPNLPGTWPEVPLAATLSAATGLPVSLLNDARAITYGEWKIGAGRGVETMACFTIGTGVGGGLVINGRLHLGIGGTAGELGHQTIDFNGPQCGCGNYGCLEVYASGPAIAAQGAKAVMQGLTTSLGQMVDYDLNKITPALVYRAAKEGDRIAQEIFTEAGEMLGVAIANILVSIGPRKVIIAGGVSRAADLLLPPIKRTLKERVHIMPVDQVEVLVCELGDNAGILGVAHWSAERARDSRFENP